MNITTLNKSLSDSIVKGKISISKLAELIPQTAYFPQLFPGALNLTISGVKVSEKIKARK